MSEAPSAEIDYDALQHNLRRVHELAPGNPVMAVVKANAYGHGLCRVISALKDADALAVARVPEGIDARQCGYEGQIVVLEGAQDAPELAVAAANQLELVVHDETQLDLLEAQHNASFRIWLKFDTGMNRLGFTGTGLAAATQRLKRCAAVARPLRLLSHFASAELPDDPKTRIQLARFEQQSGYRQHDLSLANSAAIMRWPETHYGWVRPGLMLYGISPFAGTTGADFDLKGAMLFRTRLIAVKDISAGETVGYSNTWQTSRDTRIGIGAVGYGDGYPGNLPSGTPVLVNGTRVGLAGRVSMDMTAVDLGPESDAKVGDEMVLWGPGLPVEEIATACGRIPYELVCGVSRRVPRNAVAPLRSRKSPS